MDTSDIYVNMSETAKEIQFAHSIYTAGDFYYEGRDIVTNQPRFEIVPGSDDGKKRSVGNLKTWLPRQDQLQEIMGNYFEQCSTLLTYLMKEVLRGEILGPDQDIKSMEQLLLTIVMREKYSKVWTGHNWTKLKPQ